MHKALFSNIFLSCTCSIKAFALGAFNPLVKITTIEKPHLNAFVHPCLEAALWHIAQVHYEFGEIPSRNHINCDCADGVGFMTSTDKFQLVYVEGSRPAAKDDKEAADAKKKKKITKIEEHFHQYCQGNHQQSKTYTKRDGRVWWTELPSPAPFVLSWLLWYVVSFSFKAFYLARILNVNFVANINLGKFRLNEVDNANIPRDFSEMPDFVWYYECVLKWAVRINALFRAMELNSH